MLINNIDTDMINPLFGSALLRQDLVSFCQVLFSFQS